MSREAHIAAAWWAGQLKAKTSAHVAVGLFELELARWLDEQLAGGAQAIPLTTSDCGPQLNVGECADRVGLVVGAMLWPLQAGMWVSPGSVYVHEGYNSLRQTLYP